MKKIFLSMLVSASTIVSAQTDTLYVSTSVENQIYSFDFPSAKKKVYDFITENNIKIQSQNESKKDLEIKFYLTNEQYKKYDLLISGIGYSTSKKVNTISNLNKVNEINSELLFLKQKKASYIELLNKIDDKSAAYLNLWNEQKTIEGQLFQKELELNNLNKKENKYYVSLDLNDEVLIPESTKVSFVNMPGLEYSFLKIESPTKGISAQSYHGYFLKYLFTKGKTYATVGAYKSNKLDHADTTAFSEMFLLGFGQDFYSRHLGKGSRKFLNLYSGYTAGGILATGATNKTSMFYISPSVGLELFKNKYILIDTKVNYFLPLSNNRYLRGLSYNTSINFVF
jgi:hypothetical protein